MKKILSAVFILSVFILSAAAQDKVFAKVESINGKVEVYKGSSWTPLAQGDSLSKGDIISTGFNSEAVISFKDSTVKLSPLTRMTVEQLTSNEKKEQTQLFIDSGKISASVKHAENKRTDFKVRSPVSTASVRGTDFDFFAMGKIMTTSGLVASSASTSQTAEVVESDGTAESTVEDGDSTVFTSTSDVGDAYGIPVYEGQETTTDSVTGQVIPTQLSMMTSTQDLGGFTANTGNSIIDSGTAILSNISTGAAATNNAGSGSSDSDSGDTPSVTPTPAPTPTTGSLTINLTISK